MPGNAPMNWNDEQEQRSHERRMAEIACDKERAVRDAAQTRWGHMGEAIFAVTGPVGLVALAITLCFFISSCNVQLAALEANRPVPPAPVGFTINVPAQTIKAKALPGEPLTPTEQQQANGERQKQAAEAAKERQ